jgi:predicted regulator of Ras-like GTPase activity (Roadblock/LC7/MglB family)
MAEYRAYSIGLDGHIVGYEPLICANDAEAVAKASRLAAVHAVELWSGERFVMKLGGKDNSTVLPADRSPPV